MSVSISLLSLFCRIVCSCAAHSNFSTCGPWRGVWHLGSNTAKVLAFTFIPGKNRVHYFPSVHSVLNSVADVPDCCRRPLFNLCPILRLLVQIHIVIAERLTVSKAAAHSNWARTPLLVALWALKPWRGLFSRRFPQPVVHRIVLSTVTMQSDNDELPYKVCRYESQIVVFYLKF